MNLISNLRGGHCFVSSKMRRRKIIKITTFTWATHFLTVVHEGASSPNVSLRMAWDSLGPLHCEKKKSWRWLASRFCWNFYRTKDISNESLCVFVALIIEHAKPMCRILFSSISYQTLPYISFCLCYLFWHPYSHKLRICVKSYWAFNVCINFLKYVPLKRF